MNEQLEFSVCVINDFALATVATDRCAQNLHKLHDYLGHDNHNYWSGLLNGSHDRSSPG